MPLLTTTIGAYPKPDYVPISNWSDLVEDGQPLSLIEAYDQAMAAAGEAVEALFLRGTKQAIEDQLDAGIDILTDGEIRREDYIYYHCRHLEGMDFTNTAFKTTRDGAFSYITPTITGRIRLGEIFLPREWRIAQGFADRPVKATLPGPLTITDSTSARHYSDDAKLGTDLAAALNAEVRALAEAGCRNIQIDEPVFARRPEQALAFGFENLERCLHGVPREVTRTVHACCGYPDRLDNPDYPKAPKDSYIRLADAFEASSIDALSIEDAHRHNDLTLLERFKTTAVILGVVSVSQSRIETIDEVKARLKQALDHIDSSRLIAAPDCGLAMLGREEAMAKLKNLVAAAKSVGPQEKRA
jgi:5-methyltetrahydropteroyltriglutamate--homocysteine methyltransferase